MLTVPSLAALVMFFILGVGSCNTRPMIPFNPNALPWSVFTTFFIQLILGLLFTRVAWISKTALEAEILGKTLSPSSGGSAGSSESPEQHKRTRGASRADLKEKAQRMSQSPKPRSSEVTTSVNSQEREVCPAVAVLVKEEADLAQGGPE